ncbi:MAG: 4-alpha-glucanotransferase [Candidatus Omnitrophica bacterium]|nr:4-alpha-glucanotransferase [Candidatus Omnitrophota bacterium]
MLENRASGILCHISSLPSPFGIGDLGPEAYRFVDFLVRSGQKFWQVLPINPTDLALANSPYSTESAFAFNTLFISPDGLQEDGLLARKDVEAMRGAESDVDYAAVVSSKSAMLAKAWEVYQERRVGLRAFEQFCRENSGWLDDYVLFVVLKRRFRLGSWSEWPAEYRDRRKDAMADFARDNARLLEAQKFYQFLFYQQWIRLQNYCSMKGVALIGDMPIYVNYDSVDVWSHPEFFKLDSNRRPSVVAGVPPDYFSEDGQRWGNPVYDWERLAEAGFGWWGDRLKHGLAFFDAIRIDHFRAFAQCWEIPASEETARNGAWRDVPGVELFSTLAKRFPSLPIIAEDLGIITQDVDDLKEQFGFPGMRVMLFAFHNEYKKSRDLPDNYIPASVAYTGTHDNNTVRGWYRYDVTPLEQKNMLEYFGKEIKAEDVHWELIFRVLNSVSNLAIIPLQDLLGLGREARMNKPSTVKGNWKWRVKPGMMSSLVAEKLKKMTIKAGR